MRFWRKRASGRAAVGDAAAPSEEPGVDPAERSASTAVLVSTLVLVGGLATIARTGFGIAIDVTVPVLAAGLLVYALEWVLRAAGRRLKRVPSRLLARCVASVLVLATMLGTLIPFWLLSRFSYEIALAAVLTHAAMGGAVGVLRAGPPGRATTKGKLILTLGALALLANVAAARWLLAAPPPRSLGPIPQAPPGEQLELPDPSKVGPHRVERLTYGSNNDRQHAEYGARATFHTTPVDGSFHFPGWRSDFTWRMRTRYFGYDPTSLPLNGRIWAPSEPGRYPLVLFVHGTAQMERPSEGGYAYLAELLASRGFVTASIDENFLNESWSGAVRNQHDARAWLILEHLRVWREWSRTPGHPFFERVDVDNVALVGHSRGGAAVALAAALNGLPVAPQATSVALRYGFGIRAVVAIAPAGNRPSFGGRAPILKDVSYLTLHGTHDSNVIEFMGLLQYEAVTFTGARPALKAGVLIGGANHGQFNTEWNTDFVSPFSWFEDPQGRLAGEDQRRIANVYISAFLEATLRGNDAYRSLLRDARVAPGWLPPTTYVSTYSDSNLRTLENFEEDADATTTTVDGGVASSHDLAFSREGRLATRAAVPTTLAPALARGFAMFLGWDPRHRDGTYALRLPERLGQEWRLGADSRLSFGVADLSDRGAPAVDFGVELETDDGVVTSLPLRSFCNVERPGPHVGFKIDDSTWDMGPRAEPTLQTCSTPLRRFMALEPRLAPARIRTIRFRFDRTPEGAIALDDVGFTP